MRKYKAGFTLLEVLVVLIIVTSVFAFALPSYKRTQDKNAYTAAVGVLTDLGMSLKMFRQDLAAVSSRKFPSASEAFSYPFTYSLSHCREGHTTFETAENSTDLLCIMFKENYMQPIPWDGTSSGSSFKNYEFFICRESTSSSGQCTSGTVAYMLTKSGVTRASGDTYKGARISRSGNITQISN